jgi:hypothetical protein
MILPTSGKKEPTLNLTVKATSFLPTTLSGDVTVRFIDGIIPGIRVSDHC